MEKAIKKVAKLAKDNGVEINFHSGGIDIYTACDLPGIEARGIKPGCVHAAVTALFQLVKTGWESS